jgi:hypothetical protein
MLTLNAAVDVVIQALDEVRPEASDRVAIQLTDTLADLGISTTWHTQVFAESIMTSLGSRNHWINKGRLNDLLKPEWNVRDVAELITRFALPGDETFGEDDDHSVVLIDPDEATESVVGEEAFATELEDDEDLHEMEETAGLAGDEDFAEDAALPGKEDFDEI